MRLWIAVTDSDWFHFLRSQEVIGDVNFWNTGKSEFRALAPGELFLFKLHSPQNYIAGGGFFQGFTRCPFSLAWQAFGQRNGFTTWHDMRRRIAKYRREPVGPDYPIGCVALGKPFFWDESQWIPAPADFPRNIVSGKRYEADSKVARDIWEIVSARLPASGTDQVDSVPFQMPGLLGPDGSPLTKGSEEYSQILLDLSATNEQLLALVAGEPELLWRLSPRKFEEIVAEVLSRQGYDISLTPTSRDGGFDMYAAKKDGLGQFLYLVECKRYVPPANVGVEVVRSLYGTVQAQRATAGVVVTTSYFTACAKDWCQNIRYQMHLHDFVVLQGWLKTLGFAGRGRRGV